MRKEGSAVKQLTWVMVGLSAPGMQLEAQELAEFLHCQDNGRACLPRSVSQRQVGGAFVPIRTSLLGPRPAPLWEQVGQEASSQGKT